jgi:hypothetical protein
MVLCRHALEERRQVAEAQCRGDLLNEQLAFAAR